jgi:hypothetical protein
MLKVSMAFPGGHAGTERRVGLLHDHLHLEHLRVLIGTLLPHVGHAGDPALEPLGRIGVQGEDGRLAHRDLPDVDLVDVGDRLHLSEVGEVATAGSHAFTWDPVVFFLPFHSFT